MGSFGSLLFECCVVLLIGFVAHLRCLRYRVTIVQQKGLDFASFDVIAKTVILAAPPFAIRQFSVAKMGLNPALFAVHERRLG